MTPLLLTVETAAPKRTVAPRVERVSGEAEFASLQDDWNRLAGDFPLRRWDWLAPWWRTLRGKRDELFVLTVRDEADALVAIAPWCLTNSVLHGRLARFLGYGPACTDYAGILATPAWESRAVAAIGDWLRGEGRESWDTLQFEGFAQDDNSMEEFASGFPKPEYAVARFAGPNCWRIDLPATWPEYLSRLSSTRRYMARKIERTLLDSSRTKEHLARTPEELEIGFGVLRNLHERRRASLGHEGCFANRRFERFLREVADRFLSAGRLRLTWTELDGQPATAHFELIGGKGIALYQAGMSPDQAKFRPGWLGIIASLRWAIDRGYASFDFLRGDEAYKANWRAIPRPLAGLRIVSPRLGARVRHGAWRANRWGRRWLKETMRRLGIRDAEKEEN